MLNFFPASLKNNIKKVHCIYYPYLLISRLYKKKFRGDLYRKWIVKIEPNLWLPVLREDKVQFSIVLPVFNPPVEFLKCCVDSVISQTYVNWQLVIVDDGSTCPNVKAYLTSLACNSKILLVSHKKNLNISQATNTGLKYCSGNYVAFLDHDDILSPHALNEVASLIVKKPQLKWIYSDEDFISTKGKRLAPHFKSDWNPFLLRSHNYITHLSVFEKALLDKVGGCRVGFEGAQDFDLALRVSRELNSNEIGHIAKVLYHWRVHGGSTAQNAKVKPNSVQAGQRALEDHLSALNLLAKVSSANLDNYYHVSYLTKKFPKVSIVIPTRDHKKVLENCINSIVKLTDYPNYEVVIIDNQTQEIDAKNYLESLKKNSRIKVIHYDKAFNYSAINNEAVKYCDGNILIFLNNDTEIIASNSSWLRELIGLAVIPEVGCVGAKLLYPDDTIQHAGVVIGLGGYAAHSHRCMKDEHYGYFNRPHVTQVVSAVTGACLAIRKSTFIEIGGFDDAFEVAYNDVDLCLRVRKAGFYNVYCPQAKLYHFESKTRGADSNCSVKAARFEKEKKLLNELWGEELINDPYYSPHLTRDAENFSIRNRYL